MHVFPNVAIESKNSFFCGVMIASSFNSVNPKMLRIQAIWLLQRQDESTATPKHFLLSDWEIASMQTVSSNVFNRVLHDECSWLRSVISTSACLRWLVALLEGDSLSHKKHSDANAALSSCARLLSATTSDVVKLMTSLYKLVVESSNCYTQKRHIIAYRYSIEGCLVTRISAGRRH